MKYEVRCECGNVRAVGAADAGGSFRCACGREVDVPPLHVLRASAGEMGVSPTVQLQAMLLQNELPGTRVCACCHRGTDHQIRVSVVCERVILKTEANSTAVLLGCLAFGWIGALAAHFTRAGGTATQHGTDVSFTLPVCVCEVCDHDLTTPAALRTALHATPIYAALFEQYPNALVRRVG